eukprot:m.228519 g.228519  ORF g.228519 m.228519 type:complete len:428 (+) comp17504_c0_seq1:143-1426(+)
MASPKRVVVVGGGYAGCSVAHTLDKNRKFHVTLIDPSEFKYHSVASLRAAAETSGSWVPRILIPRNLKNGKFICTKVVSVDTTTKEVHLENGDRVPYDYLVLATGSSTSFPSRPDSTQQRTRAGVTEQFAQLHTQIKKSTNIAVIGGGATGTELAGELRYWNRDKQVTLFHVNDRLGGEGFKPAFYKKVNEQLTELGVTLRTGTRAEVEGGASVAADGVFPQPSVGPCTVRAGGEAHQFDLVFVCTGARRNIKLVQDSFSSAATSENTIKVAPTLQVEGHPEVFACGDIASKDPRKLAFVAGAQAALVVKNIVQHDKGGSLSTSESGLPPASKLVTLLALSPRHGVGQLPVGSGFVVGRIVARLAKTKTLLCDKMFAEVGLPLPALPPGAPSCESEDSWFSSSTATWVAVGALTALVAYYAAMYFAE